MSRINKGLYSSADHTWQTPKEVFLPVLEGCQAEKFDMDVCTTGKNIPALIHFTEKENGLIQDWHGQVWMNQGRN